MHPRKLKEVSDLEASDRYAYFIRKVCDFEVVWGLHKDGWATAEMEASVIIPVWPEREFAEQSASGEWSGHEPREIPLKDFIDRWIPGATADRARFSVFPTSTRGGVVVENQRLLADLLKELAAYE